MWAFFFRPIQLASSGCLLGWVYHGPAVLPEIICADQRDIFGLPRRVTCQARTLDMRVAKDCGNACDSQEHCGHIKSLAFSKSTIV